MGRLEVIGDQKRFFNENAALDKPALSEPIFSAYVNKEQDDGFAWLADRTRILDYGCGTGTSIATFQKANPGSRARFVGVDIAEVAVAKIKRNYPAFDFHVISGNKIPQLEAGSVDGAYLLHVLHHSREHEDIFREIFSKLAPGGKFFLSDLSSNNPAIRLARTLFLLCPAFIRRRFADDLSVDAGIPEKYKVDPSAVEAVLRNVGFTIEEAGYGHWGFFLLGWMDRFLPLSRLSLVRVLYRALWRLEERLLRFSLFRRNAEVFTFKCRK